MAAFAIAVAFPALAATPTINTYKKWKGDWMIVAVGCPNSTTAGEIVTVPSGMLHLDKFTLWMRNAPGRSGTMVLRAYVYPWDAVHLTVQHGAKYESPPRTISYNDNLFHPESFTPGMAVVPGGQYVLFASIDREYVDCTNNYELAWAFVNADVYPGGSFVYQDNAGDDLQWTSAWVGTGDGFGDLAFKAYLSP